jgi:SsrA-binding protein
MATKAPNKTPGEKLIVQNKKAGFNFFIEKKLETGMVLTGSEVKSCRLGKVQLVDAYAAVEKGELFLYKAHIAEYAQSGPYYNHLPTRKRKLLAHRKQILNLQAELDAKGFSLVPIRMYFLKGKVKLELGLGKGKTKGDKRQSIAARDQDRDLAKARRRSRDFDDE